VQSLGGFPFKTRITFVFSLQNPVSGAYDCISIVGDVGKATAFDLTRYHKIKCPLPFGIYDHLLNSHVHAKNRLQGEAKKNLLEHV
jgi:hypothetical protein